MKKLICYLDGDALCIIKKDFINLHESESIFLVLNEQQIKEIQEF